MKRQLKKQGLAKQWKHTQRQRAQQDGEEGDEQQQQEEKQPEQAATTNKRKSEASAVAAPAKKQKHKPDKQPALTSASTRFYSLLADPTFAASSSSSSPSSTLDAMEMQYLEDKLGLKSAKAAHSAKLRREMAEDGLDGLFELVEGIETGMTEAQKRRVMREEGIGEEEYAEIMVQATQESTPTKQPKRREIEEVEEERGESEEGLEEEEDEDQLLPEPDEDEMERYYREDEEKELTRARSRGRADEDEDEDDVDAEEMEDDGDEQGEEEQTEQADDDDSDEQELEQVSEDERDDAGDDDAPPHRKLTRDELYGFNAPTPQSLIDFKSSGQTTSTPVTALATASSTTASKYIPPHLRNKSPTATTATAAATAAATSSLLSAPPADTALLPRITGLLNRLNEQNVEPIAAQLLPLYDAHSRSAVNGTLAVAVLTQLVGGTAASVASTFVMSVSGLLFLLHYTEEHGTAAYLLEHALLTLRNTLSSASTTAPSPSITAAGVNVVNFLCHLYLFGVTSSTALFDLLTRFSTTLTPLHTELLATILTHTGTLLRKQNPTALKDTVLALHRTAAQLSEAERGGRVGFLLALVSDVKNNRMVQHAVLDAMTPLQHGLLNVVKRRMGKRVGYDESRRLTFGYEDVRRIEERGRWWIVGAAYKGAAGGGEREEKPRAVGDSKRGEKEESVVDEEGDINYVQLARQQGYHLPFDIRVFCILLSSVDYLQAVEALDKLNIRQGSQWRSVIAILLDCVRRSRSYNPYFALVTLHLCQSVRPARFTLQLVLWDTFTALAALPPTTQPPPAQQAASVGQYVAQLLQSAHGPTVWAVWRHIEWTDGEAGHGLYGVMLDCVRTTVLAVLGAEGKRGDETVRFVFGGGKRGQEVVVDEEKKGRKGGSAGEEERVRDGLLMFLSRHVEVGEARKGKKRDEQAELIARRVKIAREALADAL